MMGPAVREQLADLLRDALPDDVDAEVLPYGVVGQFDPPCIVFGQPDVEFNDEAPCIDKSTVGVAVVVRWEPDGSAATQIALEELWPRVAGALRHLTRTNPTLDGMVAESRLVSASYGEFAITGTEYPAQLLTLEIYN